MEIESNIKYLKISPKKLRMIVDGVKKLKPVDAVNMLFYSNKKGAKILLKAIKSAISNAKNLNQLDEHSLKFKLLLIDGGPSLKRFRAGGRGTAKPFRRRTSHIKIILMTDSNVNPKRTVKSKLVSTKKNKNQLKVIPPAGSLNNEVGVNK
jgi:large subunit ribosomal protein L22